MSIIASTYNTGTGLSVSVAETTLPPVIDDLTVNGNLIVIETTVLNGQTIINNNLNITGTTTSNNAIINNNLIITNGVGQNNTSLFKLPLTNGTTDQILTISDDTTNPILTEWKDAATPINDYVQYNNDSYKLKRNLDLVISDINKLSLNDSIGLNNLQQFKLPSNTSTSGNGFKLTIIDQTTSPITTAWTSQYYANNFLRSDSETFRLLKVVDQVEIPVNDLSVEGVFGKYGEGFQLPTNSSTADAQSVLTLFNATTKSTLWQKPFATVAYNTSSYTLSSNDPSIVDITNLTLNGQIGKTSQQFSFPSNTSTAPSDSMLHITTSGLRTTIWKIPFANVAYDGSSYKFSTNNPSIVDITNIALDGQIGKTNQLFSLPSNTSTAPASSVLTLSDSTTRTTTWTTIPNITDYVRYNPTLYELSRVLNGTASTITNLTVNNALGRNTAQRFGLPTNCSTAPAGALLSINVASTTIPSTIWTTALTCTSLNGGTLSSNALTIGDVQVAGITNICCNSLRSGDINISNISNVVHNISIGNNTANQQGLFLNSKYILIGSETATSTITLNRPLNPVYTFTAGIYSIGGTGVNSPGATACTSGTPVTVASAGNVPFGVYQIFYQIKYTITVASMPFTEQRVGLCNTINAINTVYNNIETLENQSITRPVGSYSITGTGVWVNSVTPGISTAYLNIRNTFSAGTLSADATLRLVRIG